MRLGNQKQQENKIAKLNFFYFVKTIIFKVMEPISYLLISENYLKLSSVKSQMKLVIMQEISYD